ncbi:DNA glycosylase [Xylaria intraflava]|nr:DNA glycosylase [Xylaria intraflava]
MARPAAEPPRRITRSSLARFAYSNTPTPDKPSAASKSRDKRASPDIEDAVPDLASSARSRKRKRATTAIAARTIKDETNDNDDDNNNSPELKSEILPDAITLNTVPTKPTKQQRKQPQKSTDSSTGRATTGPPSGWEEMYAAVQSMRSDGGAASNAPVDTMGCERLALPTATPRDQRFQTLVALMLSSQTKDTVNAVAMHRLQTELAPCSPGAPPGLNLENILAVAPARLNELIHAVGFHNNKTKYLQQAAAICRDEHGGDIPDTIEGLVSLPGVGPKMAHLCMSAAWGRTMGIGVDVHVHRITNLWGWHGKSGSKNPEDTRAKLESWLPRDKWREINTLLVGLGQTVCLPARPRCGDCELGLGGLCRAADRKKVLQGRRLKEEVMVDVPNETVTKVEGEKVKVENKQVKLEDPIKEENVDDGS